MPEHRTPGFSARHGRSPWVRAKSVALLPLVLLVALYSAFGIVFLVVPGRVLQTLISHITAPAQTALPLARVIASRALDGSPQPHHRLIGPNP